MKNIKETQQKQTNMQTRNLQLKRVLSAALFVLLLSVAGMKNALAQIQNYPVATLQHNGSISAFYGSNAFVNANAAALDGDTITLSGGNFNGGCMVSNAITIHGAGCVMDTVTGMPPTVITGIFLHQTNDTLSLLIEGIHFNSVSHPGGSAYSNNYANYNVYFLKCDIDNYEGDSYWHQSVVNSHFEDCIIGSMNLNSKGVTITNCVMKLRGYNQQDQNNPNAIFNSVVLLENGVGMDRTVVMNSIIKTTDNNSHTNSSFFNNIGIKKGTTSIFEDMYYSTNMEVNDYADVFETFDGTVTYDNIYQLKEEILNTFSGNDGTQVGIYGGPNPYNTYLPYMIMKRCNVAGSTDSNHKLSVEIELRDNGE